MKISVKVKAGAKQEKVEKVSEGNFAVWVREKPQDGKANEAVQEMLAEYFDVAKSRVTLISGQKSKTKLFEIL